MRTTLTLDHDVADKTRALARRLGKPFKAVVNEALRLGLKQVEKPAKRQRYQTQPHAMGLRQAYSLDNIQELLAQVEGEDFR
jgi:hypothetical protein